MTMRHRVLAGLVFCLAAPAQALTLDEAIDAALRHAPAIAISEAELDGADARVREAWSHALPTATASGTLGTGRLDPRGYFGLQSANVTPRAAQLTIEQPLFSGGRIGSGIARARAGRDLSTAGRTQARSAVTVATVEAYGQVLTARQMERLYAQLVTQMQEMERHARLRHAAGETSHTDISQAETRLAEAEAALQQARSLSVSAAARFANLTGLQPQDLQPLPSNPSVPASLEDAQAQARANNPTLQQAEAALQAARAAARGARAERLPMVGAFAEGSMVRDQFFPGYQADGATVGVRASWQLFAGGRVSARIAESDSAVRAADARMRDARQMIDEQTISAFQQLHTASLVAEAAARQARTAAEARDHVRHEVRVGLKPQIDLLDAEREAAAAGVTKVRADSDRILSAYRFLALVGR